MQKEKELDQFYTNPSIAKECLRILYNSLTSIGHEKIHRFIEPSAGDGSFYNILPENTLAFDLEPKAKGIKKADFLKEEPTPYDILMYDESVVLGNPPFGCRAKLAIKFFNRSTLWAPTIAFIVPIQFRKWSVHSKIHNDYRLLKDHFLPKNAFIFNEKAYHVNSCFQIWSNKKNELSNLRIIERPKISHPDFDMWQYNNTKEAEKVFFYNFDFAILRQGYGDYNKLYFDEKDCDRKKQWILFKAHDPKTLERLKKLDFCKLANKNTTVPGFGKADVIEEYNKLYE